MAEGKEVYASPEQILNVLPPAPDFTPEYVVIEMIKGYLDTESEPAYTRRMGLGYYGGGAELD